MKMATTLRFLPVILLLITGCALAPVREPEFYSNDERQLLEKTCQALDYGYGYDDEVELYYIFPFNTLDQTDMKKKEKGFAEALGGIDPEKLLQMYERIYRLDSMTRYRLFQYKDTEKWKFYTYINNYLYPPLDMYRKLLLKQLQAKNPSVSEELPSIQTRIDDEVVSYYQDIARYEELMDLY
jgi:hypothetical protein